MFLDSFIRYIQFQKKYSLHTLSSYKKDLSNYLHFIESKGLTVEQADHQVVRAYVAQLLSLEMQPRSVNKCLSTLRSFYKFLLREELVQKNPMLLVRNLKTLKIYQYLLMKNAWLPCLMSRVALRILSRASAIG